MDFEVESNLYGFQWLFLETYNILTTYNVLDHTGFLTLGNSPKGRIS